MFSVIFDMDGTLIDTMSAYVAAWEAGGQEQGIEGMGAYVSVVCGMNDAGWLGFIKEKHPSIDTARFYDFTRRYVLENAELKYMRGAVELLEFLRANNIKCAIASGSSKETVEHHIKALKGERYFDAYACGSEVENGKPAPDVFLLAAERLGVKPSECYVFEDSSNGVISAYVAGMRAIGIADIVPFGEKAKALLWRELSHLGEAIEMFEKLIKGESCFHI